MGKRKLFSNEFKGIVLAITAVIVWSGTAEQTAGSRWRMSICICWAAARWVGRRVDSSGLNNPPGPTGP